MQRLNNLTQINMILIDKQVLEAIYQSADFKANLRKNLKTIYETKLKDKENYNAAFKTCLNLPDKDLLSFIKLLNVQQQIALMQFPAIMKSLANDSGAYNNWALKQVVLKGKDLNTLEKLLNNPLDNHALNQAATKGLDLLTMEKLLYIPPSDNFLFQLALECKDLNKIAQRLLYIPNSATKSKFIHFPGQPVHKENVCTRITKLFSNFGKNFPKFSRESSSVSADKNRVESNSLIAKKSN